MIYGIIKALIVPNLTMFNLFLPFIFALGLGIGSFLNVVIFRLDGEKKFWQGRSACPKCQHQLAWFDNIPLISFLLLSGKCRYCQKPISWQYPLVELVTACFFAFLFFNYGFSPRMAIYAVYFCFLLVILVYDWRHQLIPDSVSLPAIVLAFFASWYLGLGFLNLVLAAIIGSGFFALQYFLSKGTWVGGGDIRLGALMGLILGWKYLLVALFLAYLIGGAVGLVLLAKKRKQMKSAIAFGPFLVIATLITMFWGREILVWYLNLLYL